MIVLALTGSIGMGKSTTAQMFADAGIPVWDADSTVHRLYANGGAAVPGIKGIAPEAIVDGAVDRSKLRDAILADSGLLKKVEAIVHPLVGRDRSDFLTKARSEDHDMAIVDIPLLFEGGGENHVDLVVVVTAPAETQRERVLARPGMTEQAFEAILAKQVPDAIKREKADYLIDSSQGLEHAEQRVLEIIAEVRKSNA